MPAKRDVVAREEVAQRMAGEIEAMADDRHRRNRRLDRQLLQSVDARRHHLQQLRIEQRARDDQLAEVGLIEAADARRLCGAGGSQSPANRAGSALRRRNRPDRSG